MKNIYLTISTIFAIFISNFVFSQTNRILFIGNSYTYVNNLPEMLYNIAITTNDTIVFEMSAPGGYTFKKHTQDPNTLRRIVEGKWDYVVLQEQSQLPSFPINQVLLECFPFARTLDSLINEYNGPCVETVFYITWGRKDGDAQNCPMWPPVCTYQGMDSLLNMRYMMMARDNDAIVSPVGAVWKYIRTNHPSIELYSGDGSHPSLTGTYAAALTFYTTILRKNPKLTKYNPQIPQSEIINIKNAVYSAVYQNLSSWFIGKYDSIMAINCDTTSVFSNYNDENIISISPNPATNSITVDYINNNKLTDIFIYSSHGRFIKSFKYVLPKQIDISGLPAGVYFIRIDNKKTIPFVKSPK